MEGRARRQADVEGGCGWRNALLGTLLGKRRCNVQEARWKKEARRMEEESCRAMDLETIAVENVLRGSTAMVNGNINPVILKWRSKIYL